MGADERAEAHAETTTKLTPCLPLRCRSSVAPVASPEFRGKQVFITGYGRQDEAPEGLEPPLRFVRPGQVIKLA